MTRTATLTRTVAKALAPQPAFLYDGSALDWMTNEADSKYVTPLEHRREVQRRVCVLCECSHPSEKPCDNSEWETRVCPRCFLELPLTGICGNCE